MGLPYSKQINAAFEQVTPLVGAGFKVLETTKNIAVLLAWIQIFTVLLLFFIFLMLAALLITANPDLEAERQAIVTPVMRWLIRRITKRIDFLAEHWLGVVASFVLLVGLGLGLWWYGRVAVPRADIEGVAREAEDEKNESGEDLEGLAAFEDVEVQITER